MYTTFYCFCLEHKKGRWSSGFQKVFGTKISWSLNIIPELWFFSSPGKPLITLISQCLIPRVKLPNDKPLNYPIIGKTEQNFTQSKIYFTQIIAVNPWQIPYVCERLLTCNKQKIVHLSKAVWFVFNLFVSFPLPRWPV